MTAPQTTTPAPGQGQKDPQYLIESLTPREKQVAVMVALALTDQQIARSLVITISTVKAHVGNIKSKLHLNNRVDICRWVLVSHYERNIVLLDNVL